MPVQQDPPMEESVYDTPYDTGKIKPYDPEAVQPTFSPAPSSEAPGNVGGTSGADGADSAGEQQLPEFDSRHTQEFLGLLYVGALTDEFEWLGHTFVIRTLKTGELFEVALAIKEYVGTDALLKAYQAAVVSACVMSVDGQSLPAPISSDPSDTEFINRFRYVRDKWFFPTIDAVYERYYQLELTVRDVVEAMGKASG